MDVVIYNDLLAAPDAEMDRQLLQGTGANGQHLGIRLVTGRETVSYTASTPSGLLQRFSKVYSGISQVASTRFLNADTIVLHPRRGAWLAKELSATMPLFQQGQLTQAIGQQDGGFVTSFGGLAVVLDPNIGTTYGAGTNEDEVYIVRSAHYLLMESDAVFVRFDEVLSQTLTVRSLVQLLRAAPVPQGDVRPFRHRLAKPGLLDGRQTRVESTIWSQRALRSCHRVNPCSTRKRARVGGRPSHKLDSDSRQLGGACA